MIQSKRILSIMLVIPSIHGGGAERVAVDLANYWAYKGYDVSILTQSDPKTDLYVADDRVMRLSTHQHGEVGLFAQFKKIQAIRRKIRQYRPDIVIGFMTSSSVYSVLANMGLRSKVIATEHAYPPSQKLSNFWLKLRKFAYPKADKVIALTQMSADWLKQNVPGSDVTIIQNAVQWPLKISKPVVPIDKPSGSKMLLAVGRLHYEKGFDLLLNAFSQIATDCSDWRLVILGEGAERHKLEVQIDSLNLKEKVIVPGRVGNLAQWYEQADLFVLSSRNEGLSNSLQEAMASGLCVVSFDCDTGPREIIRDRVDGVLVRPAEDVNALAEQLRDLMQHPEKRADLAAKAPEVLERFSMQTISVQWDNLFHELIDEKR